jgi:hypothetical protein
MTSNERRNARLGALLSALDARHLSPVEIAAVGLWANRHLDAMPELDALRAKLEAGSIWADAQRQEA